VADAFVVNVEVAIRGREDQWLMIVRSEHEEHAAGTLSMVGGTVEVGDALASTLENAARREVLEEVGVVLAPELRYLESKMFRSDAGQWVVDVVFLGAHESGEPVATNAEEVAEVRWMTAPEILQHPRTPPWTAHSMALADGAARA